MKVKKINHIGIAVEDIEKHLATFTDVLGLKFLGTQEVPQQKVKVAFLEIGESRLELLQPTCEDSPVYKYLQKNGNKPRFHHIALEVENLEKALETAQKAGLELIDEKPRIGAHNSKIAFIHPKSTAGVLTELCES